MCRHSKHEFCSIEKADGEFTRVKCVLLNCKISKVGLRAYKLQKSGQVVISMRDYVRAAVSYDKNPCGFKFVSIHIANTSTGTKIQLIVRENQQQISSAVVTMNADVIHIYMTLEELQHRYNLNAICKAKNKIAIKPGGTYILNGYYTPDKSFCCLKKVIIQDKSTLMRANIAFVLEGAIARNDSDIKSLHLPILFKSHLRDEVKHKLTPIGYRQEDESSWSRYPDYMQVVIKMMMQERAEREKRFGKLAKFHPIEGVNLSYGLSQDKKVHLYSLFCHCSACIEKYGTDTIVDCNALVATRKPLPNMAGALLFLFDLRKHFLFALLKFTLSKDAIIKKLFECFQLVFHIHDALLRTELAIFCIFFR